jgi:hypothetical protein
MMRTVFRMLRFIGFTLLEYLRSGRIMIDLIAATVFFVIFLRPSGRPIEASYFFTVTGIFMFGLTLYTLSAMLSIGDRPQGYLLLTRRLDRTSYLLGYYYSALALLGGIYGLICLVTALLNAPSDLTLGGWFLGTLPLLLNVALLAALLLMLSPLVFSPGWRLFVLGLIALAFSSNFIPTSIYSALPGAIQVLLDSAQTILSWPLVPGFSGFALAVQRNYDASALFIIIAQLSLLVALLGLAIYSFGQRDLMFSNQ